LHGPNGVDHLIERQEPLDYDSMRQLGLIEDLD
jgi:hypothetical protein